jgi:predicted permease
MNRITQDLRVAIKQASKRPGMTLLALVTLAIGIGPNTAVFSLIQAMILRPLPFRQPQQVVQVTKTVFPKGWLLALRDQSSSFESLAGYTRDEEVNLTRQDESSRISVTYVSANFFDTLGVKPAMGRTFIGGEDIFGQDREVVLSDSLWRQNFGGDPQVIGKTIEVEDIPRQVVGVMPPEFHFPAERTQLWIPNPVKPGNSIDLWAAQNLSIFGRLKPEVSPSAALSELTILQPHLNTMFPWSMPKDFGLKIEVVPIQQLVQGNIRPRLLLLFGTVGLVLLIACGNIASLLLGRAAARRKEVAIRRAMGASRMRLLQQFLTEGVLLALCGGALGTGVGWLGVRFLKEILPLDTPRLADVQLNPVVLLFTLALSMLVGLMMGPIPALALSQDVEKGLKETQGSASAAPVNTKFLSWLVIGQVALAVVIVAGAGVMARSFWKLLQTNPGYRTTSVVFAKVALNKTACKTPGRCEAFVNALLANMRGEPQVEAAAVVNQPVLHGGNVWFGFDAEGHQRGPRDALPQGVEHIVSPEYFKAMGIPLIAGRTFADADLSATNGVIIVNAALARRFWPELDATGKHITSVAERDTRTIVGVVGDTRYTALETESGFEVYVPFGATNARPVMTLALRTSGNTDTISGQIRSSVAALDRSASVSNIETIQQAVATSTSATHSILVLLVLFSSIALLLGMMGIYGMNFYLVSWRIREIGIRMALGASPGDVKRIILFRAVLVVAAGVLCGMLLALGTTQLFKSYLYETSPLDPLTFAMIPLVFVAVALIATWIPARRAAATDPMKSLRHE